MIYKTLHIQLKTNNTMHKRNRTTGANNDLQNITQTTKDKQYNVQQKQDNRGKQWSTKHYTDNERQAIQCTTETRQQGQTMIYKTLHIQLKTNNTMHKRNRTTGANNDLQNITQTTKDKQYNVQQKQDNKGKQWSTNHYTDN